MSVSFLVVVFYPFEFSVGPVPSPGSDFFAMVVLSDGFDSVLVVVLDPGSVGFALIVVLVPSGVEAEEGVQGLGGGLGLSGCVWCLGVEWEKRRKESQPDC